MRLNEQAVTRHTMTFTKAVLINAMNQFTWVKNDIDMYAVARFQLNFIYGNVNLNTRNFVFITTRNFIYHHFFTDLYQLRPRQEVHQ